MAAIPKQEYPKRMSFPAMVFWTGLFGGLFWGTLGFLAYYFNFTEVRPNVILLPLLNAHWKYGWAGTVISIIIMGIVSVGAAFIYYLLLRKLNSIWTGIGYGIVMFLLVFFILNPILFPNVKAIFDLSRDTIITSVCLYILYGVFIGYSINYEYENKKSQEKEPAS